MDAAACVSEDGSAILARAIEPAVLPVVERVLDPECLLSLLTGVEIGPGETAQPLHADDGSLPLARPHAPVTCTAIWALTDFTEANGGTRVVPASQRADHAPRRDERDVPARATVMPAGSVLVHHGSLWHGGGANASGAPRLVGYGTYRGLLGHVDQRSPAEWVNAGATTDMVWQRIRR